MSTLSVPSSIPSVAENVEQLRTAFSEATHESYASTYNEDLLKQLDKELLSEFERVVLLWTLVGICVDPFCAADQ
ncbi:hypothetical protein QQ045_029129 [Rhodiola kirilowii]